LDHRVEAWIRARRQATERSTKFALALRRKAERGQIVAAYGDNTYDVQVTPPTCYSRLRSTDPSANWSQGDWVQLVYSHSSPWLPQILADHQSKKRSGFAEEESGGGDFELFTRGIWTQAEGQPECSGSTLQAGSFGIDWGSVGFGGFISTEAVPNASYMHRGHVYWPAELGTYSAIACWTQVTETWHLACNVGYTGGARTTVTLGPYTIEDNGGLLSQGGDVYDGGTDHGGLGLHYSRSSNSLICTGPGTHPEGRLHVYHANLTTGGAAVRSTLPKMAIHASFGHRDILVGWWGGNGSPTYYTDQDLKLLRFGADGEATLTASVAVSDLTPGNWIYPCHPSGTRARGRWPWRPRTVEGEVRDGHFAVVTRSAQEGTVTFGGGGDLEVNEGEYLPDPSTDYTVKTDQYCHLWTMLPSGTATLLRADHVDASSITVNTDSYAWYESVKPDYPTPTLGHEQQQLGWPDDGDTRISVYDAELGGDRIVHGPLLDKLDAPAQVHPMLGANPYTRSDGNAVFEWVPDATEQQPVGSYSAKGWHVVCKSLPQREKYGSAGFSAFFAYLNPAWPIWRDEYNAWIVTDDGMGGHVGPGPGPEPEHHIEERWRAPQARDYYRTYLLVHDANDGFVLEADISQELTGLRDGPVTVDFVDHYRDYEARPILDQIYAAALFGQVAGAGGLDRDGMQAVALVRDWREQDGSGPSEQRPVLQIRDHLADASLLLEVELQPNLDRYDEGNARYALVQVGRPVLRHDLADGGWPFLEVYTQWRTRTSAEDIAGDPDTHLLRVTSLVWDEGHATLPEAAVTHTDFPGLALSEQALEGLAMVGGTRLVQTDELLQGFA
jgi:hypothetical protein